MKKIKNFLIKLKDKFLTALNQLKTRKFVIPLFISLLYIFSCFNGCRSPTSANASVNSVGDSSYVYMLPPITLSNNNSNQAFIPNVLLCIEPTRYYGDNDNFVYLYTLTGSTSRVDFKYGKRQLVYNSSMDEFQLNDFKVVTVYGFNTVSSATGNLMSWASQGRQISVMFDSIEDMLNNDDFVFSSGSYTVDTDSVDFVLGGASGGVLISIPYTSYTGATTNYTGTFSPTRVISASLGYEQGYVDGRTNGYQEGVRVGYEQGLQTSLNEVTPFEVITYSVNTFLQIEIVPGVRVGLLIYLGLGILLFNFVVKMFLGG